MHKDHKLKTPRELRINDVARVAGVSPRTAAEILHGQGAAGRSVRERVRLVAERLGHHAPPGTNLLLLHHERDLRGATPYAVLCGMMAAAKAAGCHLEILLVHDSDIENEHAIRTLISDHHADGLLLDYPFDYPRALPELIARIGIPTMWLNSPHEHDCILSDDFEATKHLVRHAINLGHRSIAYMDVTTDFTSSALHHSNLERLDGYEHTMREAGLPIRLLGVELPLERSARVRLLRSTFQQHDHPTWIIVNNPNIALDTQYILTTHMPQVRGVMLSTFAGAGDDLPIPHMALSWKRLGEEAINRLVARCHQPGKHLPPLLIPWRYVSPSAES